MLVRAILRIYPRDFRESFGAEIEADLDERSVADRPRALADLFLGGLVEFARESPADVRYALRSLSKSPATSAIMVIVIAVGVGANAAIYSVVDNVLLQPLPFRNPDELHWVSNRYEARNTDGVPAPTYFDWKERAESFTDMAIWNRGVATTMLDGLPESIDMGRVSGDFFSCLGIQPTSGRLFVPSDDTPEAARTVVLSERFWKERFGADRRMIGETMVLDESPHVVIGIAPDAPNHLVDVDVWTPLAIDP